MTLSRAEKISGLEVRPGPIGPGAQRTFSAYDGDTLVLSITDSGEKRTLEVLVYKVYQLRSQAVRRAQGYRCAQCHRMEPLTIHHIIFRSHGRNDRVENLVGLCVDCHAAIHSR